MDPKILEEVGLTEGEVKVYLALLKLGLTKTGPLAALAGVSSSKVYKILDRLARKGLSGHVMVGGVKQFRALEPRRLMDFIENREKQLAEKKALVESMLPELEKEHKASKRKTEATIYEGFKAVTNFFRGLIDELGAGDTYYVIGGTYGKDVPGLWDFFRHHHSRRAKKKIRVKMLANYDIKDSIVKEAKVNAEIRYLPQYLIGDMQIVLYAAKVFIVLFTKEPKGFLIESEDAVRNFKRYFDAFWKKAAAE